MSSKQLLSGFTLGSLQLSNRVVLAPLTRGRSGDSRVPNEINAEYYAQRASAGLLITEATAVSAQGFGWAGAPGIYTEEHKVTTESSMESFCGTCRSNLQLHFFHVDRVHACSVAYFKR
jgi:2,4-dienoyl-CoA reductase-like NADH-dependent reductase (Old Yellow Enzyme family)